MKTKLKILFTICFLGVFTAFLSCSDDDEPASNSGTEDPPVLSSATDILTFTIPEQTGDADIDNVGNNIDIEVANSTDLTSLTPEWTLSDGATSDPVSGTAGDYSSTVTITVTAENGDEEEWEVEVTEADGDLSNEADILTFTIPQETGPADISNVTNTIAIEVANGTDLTSLTPEWTLSDGASSDIVSGTTGDYSSTVRITVTAENGEDVEKWDVTVTEDDGLLSAETDILSFNFPEQAGVHSINDATHQIFIDALNGTDRSNLTPTIVLSPGATSVPASGATADYSAVPTIMTVTAEDNSTTQEWQVFIGEAPDPNNKADIITFSFPEQTGPATIDGFSKTIFIEVSNGTDLTNLTPTFELSPGATSVPVSGVTDSYILPYDIDVTAENGIFNTTWTVEVTEGLP